MAIYLTKSLLNKLANVSPDSIATFGDDEIFKSTTGRDTTKPKTKNEEARNLHKDFICRVCAQQGCTPLLDKLDDEYDIMSAIRSITNITISIDDQLPSYICSTCLDILKIAHNFKKTCESTDKNFKSMLGHSGASLKQTYPYSKRDFNLILHKMKCKRKQQDDINLKKVIKYEKEQSKKDFAVQKLQSKCREIKCNTCGAPFVTEDDLSAHSREGGCRRRACELCGQLVLNMSQHQRVAHRSQPAAELLTCTTCGKNFTLHSKLKAHMKIHSNTFHFYCDLCPYRSKYKYYLVLHMRTHTGEKPYKCPQADCGATFVNPSNLNKHKLIHQDKQIKCGLCEKAFRTKVALRTHHEAAHMLIKHVCTYCERGFRYKSDLRKHEIKQHNRKKREYIGGEPAYKQAERTKQSVGEVPWQQDTLKLDHASQTVHWKANVNASQIEAPVAVSETSEWQEELGAKLGNKPKAAVEWQDAQVLAVAAEAQPVMPCVLQQVFYTADLNHGWIQQPQIVQQQTLQVLPGMSTVKKVEDKIYEPQTGLNFF